MPGPLNAPGFAAPSRKPAMTLPPPTTPSPRLGWLDAAEWCGSMLLAVLALAVWLSPGLREAGWRLPVMGLFVLLALVNLGRQWKSGLLSLSLPQIFQAHRAGNPALAALRARRMIDVLQLIGFGLLVAAG
jgi:hypothetical protein